MHRYHKEIVGVLMRVLNGGEVSLAELAELSFVAESELRGALIDAHVSLLEFACHRELRARDAAADRAMRAELETCLERIAEVCERPAPAPRPSASIH
jgi:hypothetical protein